VASPTNGPRPEWRGQGRTAPKPLFVVPLGGKPGPRSGGPGPARRPSPPGIPAAWEEPRNSPGRQGRAGVKARPKLAGSPPIVHLPHNSTGKPVTPPHGAAHENWFLAALGNLGHPLRHRDCKQVTTMGAQIAGRNRGVRGSFGDAACKLPPASTVGMPDRSPCCKRDRCWCVGSE